MKHLLALLVVLLSLAGEYDCKSKDEFPIEVRYYHTERDYKMYGINRYNYHRRGEDKRKHKQIDNESHVQDSPPDHNNTVAMARYIMHHADWTSVATMSTIPAIRGFPFTSINSMSDGPLNNSTGIPYFYLTPLDFTAKDLMRDNRCTISATLEETDFCQKKNYDPEDPRCARIMLSGKIRKVKNTTAEYAFAQNALFSRHPSMANLPANHDFFIAKLKIFHIAMLDWFGGPKFIPVHQYLSFNYTEVAPDALKRAMDPNSILGVVN